MQAQRSFRGMGHLAPRPSAQPGYQKATPELDEQKKLFRFLREQIHRAPVLGLVHSSLNGLFLFGKVKDDALASGLTAGVWDVCLNVPRTVPATSKLTERLTQALPNTVVFGDEHTPQSYSSIYIEMKHGSNGLTERQEWFRDFTISLSVNETTLPHLYNGPAFTVCHTAWEAAEVLIEYAGITDENVKSDLARNARFDSMVLEQSAAQQAKGRGRR